MTKTNARVSDIRIKSGQNIKPVILGANRRTNCILRPSNRGLESGLAL
jgi:hypothetical protein